MGCVMKIMAISGTRTAVADLCMFGLPACDKGGPGFVNVSVRRITNVRRVGARLQNKCTGTHRHARIDSNDTIEEGERTGTWVRQAARAIEEQLREDHQELEMRERKRKVEVAKKIRGIVHEKDKSIGGWLDPEMCPKARREEVEHIGRHKMCETGRGRLSQESPTNARSGSRRSTRRT